MNEHSSWVPQHFCLEPSEKEAIVGFHLTNPLQGDRRLTFMMLDHHVVAVSPASVWRVLKQAGLQARWKTQPSRKGTGFEQPLEPHQHWQFYGAKCIYLGEDGNPQIVGPRSIHVHARGNALELGRSFPANEVVQDLQNQLLFYRIARHDAVASSTFRVTGFLPEFCAIAQVLGAPLQGDPELQKGIIGLLKDLNEQVRTDRSCGLSAMVLRAVLWHCHQPDQPQVLVREIAAKANDFYREEGDSFRVSNEIVGHTLKNLGLYTRRLGNAGRGLSLDKATQKRAHELAYTNEVLPNSDDAPACGHCFSRQIQETTEVV